MKTIPNYNSRYDSTSNEELEYLYQKFDKYHKMISEIDRKKYLLDERLSGYP